MALFYFNFMSPEGYEIDEVGCEFPDVENAYLEAHRAAVEIIAGIIRDRGDPLLCQFEIVDSQRRFLMDLPFSELIRPRAISTNDATIHSKICGAIQRNHKLRREIQDELDNSRIAVTASLAAVARSRAHETTEAVAPSVAQ